MGRHSLASTDSEKPGGFVPGLVAFCLLRLFRRYGKTAPAFHRDFWKSVDFRRMKASAKLPVS
ncbi:hypothetical protein C7H09_11280 [Marinobacter fuscus]|uniref:Uncharacterized protein n=1 Tax=Marinobacter fuscus TaxID=2109942 RepID=A0A2T1K863_9GAMM|nr:hypothetical protein C7H09_11280 [Marinobacter fuscus]